MNKEQREQAEKILAVMERQKFADWYTAGGFDEYISGDMAYKLGTQTEAKEKILGQISELFNLQ